MKIEAEPPGNLARPAYLIDARKAFAFSEAPAAEWKNVRQTTAGNNRDV